MPHTDHEDAFSLNTGTVPTLVTVCLLLLIWPAPAAGQAGSDDLLAANTGTDELDEIVVTSSKIRMPRRQVGVAVSVVDSEEIELRGYATVAELLRTQPGVAVSSNGGAGQSTAVRVRGEDGFRTLALIDGVKISDPTTPQVGPRFDHLLATTDLERVEILRGPQGFIYGADAGGVINMLSRRGEGSPGGIVGLEYGSFGTRTVDAAIAGGNERGDYYVSVADVESDGFNVRSVDTLLADDDGYENTTLHAKFGWQATRHVRLQLVARNVDALTEYDGCGFPTTFSCVGESDQRTYRLSANHTTTRFTNELAVSRLDVSSRDFADAVPAFSTDGDLSRVDYTGSYRMSDSATVVYGIDLQREDIHSTGARLARDRRAAYFEYQAEFDDRLFVTVGARHDDTDDVGTHTSARVSAAYVNELERGGSLKYRASLGTGFRAPSLFEISYNRGPFAFPPAADVDLVEETTRGFDVGVEYRSGRGMRAELSYFDQRIEDQIVFDLAGFSGYLQERGESPSRGIELAVDLPLGERWTVFGNVTFNDADDAAGLQRIRRPRFLGNAGVRFTGADQRLRVLVNYRLSRDAVDEIFLVGRVPLDDYHVFDLSSAFRVSAAFELYARIENLFDRDYEEVGGFNSAGRAGYVGVRWQF